MNKLDELRAKTRKTPLEDTVVLLADCELEARKDGKNIIASLAAEELAALQERVRELEKKISSLETACWAQIEAHTDEQM